MRTTVWVEGNSVRYYDPVTGKKQRIYCDTKDDLKRVKAETELMLVNRRFRRGNPSALPLVVFSKYIEWLAVTRRPSTIKIKRASVEPFLSSLIQMRDITAEKIETWARDLAAKYSVDTVSIRLRDLRSFLRWCVKYGHLTESPFRVPIPESTFVGRRITPEEEASLEKACSPAFLPLFVLWQETGARKGEVLGMEWNELSLAEAWWTIPAHKCKTKISRTIPLTDRAVGALRSILGPNAPQPSLGHVFKGWTPFDAQRHWKRAKKLAGITGRLRIHDIRHTFASTFRGRDFSLMTICGWSSDEMMRHYKHTLVEELREDMNKKNGVDLGHNE